MSDVPEIDIDTLEALLADGVVLVDVREADEYESGHLSGAIHLALTEFPERYEELPADGRLHVICAMGGRSARAVQFLLGQGYDAVNVAGGTRAWVESGRPVVTGTDPR